ncbi:glycoside hydrolase family 9 protein [Cellvibrio sp. PSBB023]|uniref:glycoside hydrolase family 9 protein n=1 Tax=Cellvibrio sp. PSBB023 TaxID=1945512 RepID=UPI00098EB881|nr:glycoside hydrolase family 9 protein [Cellvibrio sp. PSBB023]AQT61205.1 LacI family transcriptional regulator [Cellvibrio sp. PSBB023]
MNTSKLFLMVTLSGLITACGGGGGSGGGSAPASKATSSIALASSLAPSSVAASSLAVSSTPIASSVTSAAASSVASGAPTISGFIVVDQFGYLPDAKKVAVIRDPQTGYDAALSFTPGATYQLINLDTNAVVLSGSAVSWKSGATFDAAGDKAWWFDFSSVTTPGTYAVVDVEKNVRSPGFKIGADIYKPVLKHAMRIFFYQRAGFAKQAPFAEAGWTDSASHIGAGQDKNARLFSDKNNAATERDLSGGWYDAGDYNKYTNWHAYYLVALLHAYAENPTVWTDDYNIPESGNGVPDIIDEIKWGFDWLKKMQNADGSVLSILGLSHASPPSAATGPSYYGPASTSATLTSAGAFALGSKILTSLDNPELNTYAADLKTRAENAWIWAVANPDVIFRNNECASAGLGAGQQEVDDAGRATKKTIAAIYLFAATGSATYRSHVDANANNATSWVSPWNEPELSAWLYYASLPDATTNIATTIKSQYQSALNSANDNWKAVRNGDDPYRVHLSASEYTWGSNRTVSRKGLTFHHLIDYEFSGVDAAEIRNAALGSLHYIHGVNPQAMVYLSNMYSLGVHSSVNEFYHSWFSDGSALWDRVGTSTYGPAPGFLVGGPNPSYNWDGNCTSASPNPGCGTAASTPPKGQPAMKAYLDFNTSWPLNSWEVTENHNDYQVAYIRLLSKFVPKP